MKSERTEFYEIFWIRNFIEKLLFYAMLASKRAYKPKMTYGSYIFFVYLLLSTWLNGGLFLKKIVIFREGFEL